MGHTPGGAESGAVGAREAVQDADLAEIIRAWPALSESVRQGILEIARAALNGATTQPGGA
jgi:predicted TIM-barrel enzyme